MNKSLLRPLALAACCVASVYLTGCANRARPLYEWGSYQDQVYAHFKATSSGPEEQVIALERDLEKIRANNATPPPGYYAHLGMLYASLGREDQTAKAFESEKALFPESARYLDFLLSKSKKK